MNRCVRHCIDEPCQNGIQFNIALTHCKTVIHIYTCVDRSKMQFFALFGNVIIAVVTNNNTVRPPVCYGLQPCRRIRKIRPVPVGIMLRQKPVVVGVTLIDSYGNPFFEDELFLFRSPHHCVHLRAHQRRGHHDAQCFTVIFRKIGRKYAINLAFF